MKSIIYDLAGTAKIKILYSLNQDPGKSFFEKEIAQKAKVSRGAANENLNVLAKQGLVLKEKKGRMNFYRANLNNPLVKSLKTLVNVGELLPLLKKLQNISLQVILFGSLARGENYPDSDVDLLILTHSKNEVDDVFKKVSSSLFKPIIKTPAEFSHLEINNSTLYKEITRGLILWEKDA